MKIFKAFFPRPVPGFWDLVVGKYGFILGRQIGAAGGPFSYSS
jgi:hypothetical protein